MAVNDVVLLDSLVSKAATRYGAERDLSEYFELFAIDQALKDTDLSHDELEGGWTDSGDDGGIDGFYVLLDGKVVTEEPDAALVRRGPQIELVVFTAKHGEQFKQIPINNLISSLPELLDLRKGVTELTYPFAEAIIAARELFRATYIGLAPKNPTLKIRIIYASRGDTSTIMPNVASRASQLEKEVNSLFSNAVVKFDFLGAAELLKTARREKTYSLRLGFVENNISRDKTNYVVLSPLDAYFKFVTDEEGNLRRYLFEANVRDYLGDVQVNRDITTTLKDSGIPPDFWWLNNGITLLASTALIAGKELHLENVQIVNGLQTTETIYKYFSEDHITSDQRAILIKIIVTQDDEIKDRIIKATNYQNGVELASLRGTDILQRNIEHFLGDNGWYYDRRKNYYKNQGCPADKIISISYLGAAVRALVWRDPSAAFKQKTRWMREDDEYQKIFNTTWDLRVYLLCVEHMRSVDLLTRKAKHLKSLKFHIALLYVCQKLRSINYEPEALVALVGAQPTAQDVADLGSHIYEVRRQCGNPVTPIQRMVRKSKSFTGELLDALVLNGFMPLKGSSERFSSKKSASREAHVGKVKEPASVEVETVRARKRHWWQVWK